MYNFVAEKKLTEYLRSLPDLREAKMSDIIETRKVNGLGCYLNKLLVQKTNANQEVPDLLYRAVIEINKKK